jgi:hypothetical protein
MFMFIFKILGSYFLNADFLVFVPSSSYIRAKIIVLDVNL